MCTVAAFISEEAFCKEFRTLCQSCHHRGLHPSSQVVTEVLFIWGSEQTTSSGEFNKALLQGHERDLENNLSPLTLTLIMRTFPFLAHSFSFLTSVSTSLIPTESSQPPTPSPWNGHCGTATYISLVCTCHSVEKNGTPRGMRAFHASTACLALWHWWL